MLRGGCRAAQLPFSCTPQGFGGGSGCFSQRRIHPNITSRAPGQVGLWLGPCPAWAEQLCSSCPDGELRRGGCWGAASTKPGPAAPLPPAPPGLSHPGASGARGAAGASPSLQALLTRGTATPWDPRGHPKEMVTRHRGAGEQPGDVPSFLGSPPRALGALLAQPRSRRGGSARALFWLFSKTRARPCAEALCAAAAARAGITTAPAASRHGGLPAPPGGGCRSPAAPQ